MTVATRTTTVITLAASLPETERNRLLRRVDWRFLGSTPVGARTVCFGDASLAFAMAAAASCVVEPDDAVTRGDCDVAVAVNPDAQTLRRAWAAVRPGGTCYTEWTGLRAGGPWGVRRRLERAGWEGISCYTPRPDPDSGMPRVWVPLDSSAATRYFLQRATGPARATRRAGRIARRALWLMGRNARFSRRLCVLARKPRAETLASEGTQVISPLGAVPDFTGELMATVRSGWEGWSLGLPLREPSLLLQTGGPRSVSKVIGLVFMEGTAEPALVIKLPRVPESIAPLRTEAEALRALDGRAGVPRLLFARTHAGVYTVGQTVVRGAPLVDLEGPPQLERLAEQATDWLAALGEDASVVAPSEWYDRLVNTPLERFVSSFGSVLDAGMVRETEDLLRALGPLPLVCEHRDFSPWNVLLDSSGQLGVLDWEGAELRGLPALDLIYFLTYWSFFHDRAESGAQRQASHRAALTGTTRAGATSRDCLERYATRLRIPFDALKALRLLVWIVHSRSEHRRLVEDAGGAPQRSLLDGSLFVTLWREELRRGAGT